MLNVKYYATSNELQREINSLLGRGLVIICPNPAIADEVRSIYPTAQVSTINEFYSKEWREIHPDKKIVNKSEYYFELWSEWRKEVQVSNLDYFFKCLKIVTELRGYSPSSFLVKEIIEEQVKTDPFFNGVNYLLNYFEEKEISDENLLYAEVANHFEGRHLGEAKEIVFWGFQILNGNQVDSIFRISEKINVSFFFPDFIKTHLVSTDWISWLEGMGGELKDHGKEEFTFPSHPRIEIDIQEKESLSWELQEYSSGIILDWNNQHDNIYSAVRRDDCQGKIKLSPNEYYLETLIREVELGLEDFRFEAKSYFENKRQSLFNNRLRGAWLDFKVYELFEKTMKSFFEYRTEEEFDRNDLLIIKEKILLDLPRISLVPGNVENRQIILKNFSQLNLLSESEKIKILIMDFAEGSGSLLDESLLVNLSSIGPLPNFDLVNKLKVGMLLASSDYDQAKIIIEPHVFEKTSLFDNFREVLKSQKQGLDEQVYPLKTNIINEELFEHELDKSFKFSPSRIQTYLNCPRKYKFQYIERVPEVGDSPFEFSAREEGEIVHKIIEFYFKDQEDRSLEAIVVDHFESYLKTSQKSIDDLLYKEVLLKKLLELCFNGIEVLEKIKELKPESEFSFEKDVDSPHYRGRIDCLLTIGDEFVILDFKRSEASIPSLKEIKEGKSAQIPIYGTHQIQGKTFVGGGYICLRDTERSLFVVESERMQNLFSNLSLVGSRRIQKVLSDDFEFMQTEIQDSILDLSKDQLFEARPLAPKVCAYCSYYSLCDRVEKNEKGESC
ncbi:MAG: PD-(D/E)XK nuclease family protein, partial [Bacteriovoracaceae bacterium]